MSRKLQYNIVLAVGWLIGAGFIIIPRLIFKPLIIASASNATNATNADIVNAIYSLHTAIDSIQIAIYTAMAIGICVICVIIAAIKLK